MVKKIFSLFRVSQWIKNLFVFVPLMFSKHLFEPDYSLKVLLGFFIFSLVSSVVYTLNDIADVESDRLHPIKKNRPIASGAISKSLAYKLAIATIIVVIALLPFTSRGFIITVALYLISNHFYSRKFKNMALLDVFSIAAGFMMRVIAGALIINVYISSWLILTTMFISLFLGVMKRRSEIELTKNDSHASTRKVLEFYTVSFIDQIAAINAAGVIICYALYTVSDRTVKVFGTENLIYTTPFVAFGIFRYMFLVHKGNEENASDILVSDVQMIVNILLYLISVVLIIYFIR
jgi:4-hydroxybenzoate polyprenyltransferase